MMTKHVYTIPLVFATMFAVYFGFVAYLSAADSKPEKIKVTLRERSEGGKTKIRVEEWNTSETAIIICDMWDKHWCNHAGSRVNELAVLINDVITIARGKGIRIIHAPNGCMDTYKDHTARKEAQTYGNGARERWYSRAENEDTTKIPLDFSDHGCSECKEGGHGSNENAAIEIKEKDIITDKRGEVHQFLNDNNIRNVVVLGTHANICILGQPYGLRAMKTLDKNVVLMRDATDIMYNNVKGSTAKAPNVDHYAGLDLMVDYIEQYIAPSITSTDFTGKPEFRFKEDTRKGK